jgi:hypothetical protein
MHALRSQGHEAEIVAIPFKWYPPERILEQVLACRLLDLSESGGSPIARVIGLKFPVFLIPTGTKSMASCGITHVSVVRSRSWDYRTWSRSLVLFPMKILKRRWHQPTWPLICGVLRWGRPQ